MFVTLMMFNLFYFSSDCYPVMSFDVVRVFPFNFFLVDFLFQLHYFWLFLSFFFFLPCVLNVSICVFFFFSHDTSSFDVMFSLHFSFFGFFLLLFCFVFASVW